MNAWYVQCKPGNNQEVINQLQEDSLAQNFFGMGWRHEVMVQHENETMTPELMEEFRSNNNNSTFTTAQNRYAEIEEGDVVLTRLQDNYYWGIVCESPYVSSRDSISWEGQVWEWQRIGERVDLPHHISGYLTRQDMRGTIAPFRGLAEKTIFQMAGINVTREVLTVDNFVGALGDDDLEDLMADYMIRQNPGYVILPSSCKKGTPKIEYILYNVKNGAKVTCQTKVDSEIDVGNYCTDDCKQFDRIYLFSGRGYLNIANRPNNVIIVNREDMYDILTTNAYFTSIVESFFTIQ